MSNNRDLKIATLKVEQTYQQMKVQLANELPSLNVGVSPGGMKLPNSSSFDGFFSIPIIANYEIDLFLKNHDKTKSAKNLMKCRFMTNKPLIWQYYPKLELVILIL
ncbi:MAG: TolC family protein [Candidatus Melainabacteria bacterium]|nr:MAG: TolC family protein [Candidatus Melainabacteria bacterium]